MRTLVRGAFRLRPPPSLRYGVTGEASAVALRLWRTGRRDKPIAALENLLKPAFPSCEDKGFLTGRPGASVKGGVFCRSSRPLTAAGGLYPVFGGKCRRVKRFLVGIPFTQLAPTGCGFGVPRRVPMAHLPSGPTGLDLKCLSDQDAFQN